MGINGHKSNIRDQLLKKSVINKVRKLCWAHAGATAFVLDRRCKGAARTAGGRVQIALRAAAAAGE